MRISVSQIKKANASLAEWAGQYILGIKPNRKKDALQLGNLFEAFLITGEDHYDKHLTEVEDMDKVMEQYDNLKHNAEGLEVPKGTYQHKVQGEIFGLPFVGYVDILTDDTIVDVKTSTYLSKLDSTSKNMWSGMTSMEEYELQLWAYMKVTGFRKAKILEVAKHGYKDKRHAHQVIEINWSDELDNKMQQYQSLIDDMRNLYQKYAPALSDFISK